MATPSLPVDYQFLFRSLPGLFLLLAPDGTVLDNSDLHVASALVPRSQTLGRNIFEAYPSDPESERQLFESQEKVRQTHQPDTMPMLRYDLERPDGSGPEERYWQLTHHPILDAEGQLRFILQTPEDVTEQVRANRQTAAARQALVEEQERSRFIIDNLPVFIWTADAAGQRDYFNPRWLAFTGRSMAQEVGEQWMTSLHPDDQGRVRAHWQHCVATGEPYQIEYRLRRADAQYRWILVRAAPRRNAQGQITLWVGGATDIHDQKQLVQELLETNEQQAILSEQAYQNYHLAQQQRHTLYSLLMQAPAYISIVRGTEHRYEFANEQFMNLVGKVQVVGHTVAEVFPEIEAQGLLAILDQVYQSGESYSGHEMLVRIDQGDGSGQLRDAYFNFTYQRFDEAGQAAGITAYSYEVTELVKARGALSQLH